MIEELYDEELCSNFDILGCMISGICFKNSLLSMRQRSSVTSARRVHAKRPATNHALRRAHQTTLGSLADL